MMDLETAETIINLFFPQRFMGLTGPFLEFHRFHGTQRTHANGAPVGCGCIEGLCFSL